MTRDVEIEQAIGRLDPESFARMAAVVLERDGYPTFSVNTGSGKVRSRKGVPDALCEHPDGTYSFLQCTVQEDRLPKKLHGDLDDCFKKKPRKIARTAIREVILACSERIPPELRATLKAEAKALRTKVVLYDIDRIKRVLLEKGDDIAEDYLGIKLSTQVLSREAFVKRAARTGPVTTDYNTTFRFREEEVERVLEALRTQPMVLIAGNAGVGKTRLALEVMDRLKTSDPDLRLHFIRNQGVAFAEELEKRCSAPGQYLVLLDDAHRMGDLRRVMELLVHERKDRQVRFLCTVRRIALTQVRETLGVVTEEAQLMLEPWTDDELRSFLDKEYGIQRNLYVDRILDMARGNPRTAAMVASIIKDVGNYKGFTHVAQAFRMYYKEHLDHIAAFADADRLKVLFSFAFFHHIEGTQYEALILPKLLPLLGMEKAVFWSHAWELDQLELIDLLGDEGPGLIADETFGTFLVHHMLFEKREMPLEKFLATFFDGYREKVVGAINAVLNIFQTAQDVSVLRKAVDATFTHFEQAGDEGVLQELHEAFHDLDPTRTLQFVDQLVRALPGEADGSPFLFDDEKQIHFLDAPLRVLKNYGTGDPKEVRTTAVELMLAFLERQPSKGAQVAKALVGAFDMHEMAAASGYADQREVVQQLIDRSRAGDDAATGLFFTLARNYLSAQSWRVLLTRKRMEFSSRVHIPLLNEPMKALRRMVWEHIFALYKRPEQRERVLGAMRNYMAAFDPRGDKKLVAYDAGLLTDHLIRTLDPMDNTHCILVRDILHHWQRKGIKVDDALARHFTNPTFRLMQDLRYDRSMADRAVDDVEPHEAWQQRLSEMGEGASPMELWRMLALAERIIRDDAEALHWFGTCRAMTLVLIGALRDEPEELLRAIQRQARRGDPLQLDPNELIPVLMKAIGSSALEDLIAAGGLKQPWNWWHRFYGELAKTTDRLARPDDFEERCIQAASEGSFVYLSLALHYKEQCPGLLAKLVRIAVESEGKRRDQRDMLHQLFDGKRSDLDTVIGEFSGDLELLEHAFFKAVGTYALDRKASGIFTDLVERDPNFVARWVQWSYDLDFPPPEPERFSAAAIWERTDAERLADAALAIAIKTPKMFIGCDEYLSFLFNPAPGETLPTTTIDAQDAWLRSRLAVGPAEENRCQVLLGIVHKLPEERRMDLLRYFIDLHPPEKLFRRYVLAARLARRVVGGNGATQPRISFLRKILARCTGRARLSYRAMVEVAIQHAEQELKTAQHEAIIENRA